MDVGINTADQSSAVVRIDSAADPDQFRETNPGAGGTEWETAHVFLSSRAFATRGKPDMMEWALTLSVSNAVGAITFASAHCARTLSGLAKRYAVTRIPTQTEGVWQMCVLAVWAYPLAWRLPR